MTNSDLITFIDVETTGPNFQRDRIIEIALIKTLRGKILSEFSTLINPYRSIPMPIQILTGIKEEDLLKAPLFKDIAEKICRMTEDAIISAHNANFDYGFLKSEFLRIGENFKKKRLCTLKLSRMLYPQFKTHNLDALIERNKIRIPKRHRALYDAKAIFIFFRKNLAADKKKLEGVMSRLLAKPSLPPFISQEDIEKLPESPGVYVFYSDKNIPIYTGKSKNIKERVTSHFIQSVSKSREYKIARQIRFIESHPCAGEMEALLVESKLIKTLMPVYNRRLRKTSNPVFAYYFQNREKYLEVILSKELIGDENFTLLFSLPSLKKIKEVLSGICRVHSLCPKLCALEKTKNKCFSFSLNRCKGACLGREKTYLYNIRFLEAFMESRIKKWPFTGPIMIEEKDPISGLYSNHVWHNWVHIGSTGNSVLRDILPNGHEKNTPDMDEYKILSRFLKSEKNCMKVKVLTDTQFKYFKQEFT